MSDTYSKWKIRSSSITTVVSISLVLFMLGLLGLIILNARKLSVHVKENIGFQVMLNESAKEVDIARFQKIMDASEYVKATEYVTKEEAAKKLQEDLGGEEFVTFLGFNPLPNSITVYLRAEYANQDSISWIERDLLQNKEVKEVRYQKTLVSQVNENVNKISFVIVVFTGLLMIIALALINNTIRVNIYSKRFIIRTMQLVGATQGFIRKPFIIKGIEHGIYGALIAIGLLVGILYLGQRQMPELIRLQDVELIVTLFGLVILLGIIISGISTSLAVRKYLRLKVDDLYY